jgi:hypothetical protein
MNLTAAKALLENTNYDNFNDTVLRLFHFQAEHNLTYQLYLRLIGCNSFEVRRIDDIPFLPIQFFKSHKVLSFDKSENVDKVFLSSSTTGKGQSKHYVKYLALYEYAFMRAFENSYGNIENYQVLCLLPSYAEREGSSLVYMANFLIEKSRNSGSGFYLYDHETLYQKLLAANKSKQKVLVLGVSFALLDFAEKYVLPENQNLIVMETGGMKGRRKEILRDELHVTLTQAFGVQSIHSEYGMTELLSQGYSSGKGIFKAPPWMKIQVRLLDAPFSKPQLAKRGIIQVIDLSNVFSCAFVETEDIGISHADGTFEVLGRADFSEVRGCNTMVSF